MKFNNEILQRAWDKKAPCFAWPGLREKAEELIGDRTILHQSPNYQTKTEIFHLDDGTLIELERSGKVVRAA